MERKLILVRHAQAGQGDSQKDFERNLTATGERDARHVARWLLENIDALDLILTSSAYRARQTADIIAEEFKASDILESLDELYEASVRNMIETIESLDSNQTTVLIVAHNPSITYVADYLSDEPIDGMSPGSVAVIQFTTPGWKNLAQNSGKLVLNISPENI